MNRPSETKGQWDDARRERLIDALEKGVRVRDLCAMHRCSGDTIKKQAILARGEAWWAKTVTPRRAGVQWV